MPPPSGASFAQFFPAAPRAARDRAMERERARVRATDRPSSSHADRGRDAPPARPDDAAAASRYRRDAPIYHASHAAAYSRSYPPQPPPPPPPPPPVDDNESLGGDTLNTVGSASSYASTASSVFSASAQQNGLAAAKSATGSTNLTPLTNVDSPSYSMNGYPPKPITSTPRYPERPDASSSWPSLVPNGIAPGACRAVVERVPARDPSRAVKGISCTYDPLLDKKLSSSDKRKARPTYKEFGLVCTLAILFAASGRGGVILTCGFFG